MADVQFAPPMQQVTGPSIAPPPPPPPPPPAPAVAAPELRLSPVAAAPARITNSTPVVSFQEFLQPGKVDIRPVKRKKKRGKKLVTTVVFLGILGGVGY